MPKQNKITTGVLFVIVFMLYNLVFLQGNYTAPDRSNYLNIFELNQSNRIEVGFVLLVRFFRFFFDPKTALNFYAVILFTTAYFSVYFILKDLRQVRYLPLDFHFYIIFIIFLVFGVFVFVQIRSGLVVYLSAALIYLYRTRRSKLAVPAIFSLTVIHYLAFPVFALTTALYVFRFNNIITAISGAIFIVFMPMIAGVIINFIGLNPYYGLYFIGELVNPNLLTAPSIIIYFVLFLLTLLMFPKMFFGLRFVLPVSVIVFVSAYVGLDILVKAVSPFVLLVWLHFFSRFRDVLLQFLGGNIYLFAMFILAVISVIFSIFVY